MNEFKLIQEKPGGHMNQQTADVLQELTNAIADIQTNVSRLLEAISAIQSIQQELISTALQPASATILSDYPLVLKTKDVAKIMGISQVKVYDIIRRDDFPAIREGRLIVIPRDAFFQWLKNAGK